MDFKQRNAIINQTGLLYYLKKDYHLYIMLLPALAGFLIFQYIPIINNIFIGFVDYDIVKGMWGSSWVGFKYFNQFFHDPFFFRLIKNTFLLGFYSLLWGFPTPIILALLLNEIKNDTFKRVTQSFTYLPYFISLVVIIGITYNIFGHDGTINSMITALGGEAKSFVGNSVWFRSLYIGSGIWQTAGWASIIYLSEMSGISSELYEAATMDGAGRWRQAWHITIPSIMPAIVILFILNTGNIINVGFEKVFLMYSPGIYDVSDVIQTYVYRRGIEGMDYGYAGAVSFFNSVVSLLLIYITNLACKKTGESSLF